MCGDEKCKALGLKECPSCHSILHSISSEASCINDGKKPEMVLPVAAIKVVKTLKFGRRDLSSETESEKSEEESESETESDEMQTLRESDENPTESVIKPTKVTSPLKKSYCINYLVIRLTRSLLQVPVLFINI